MGKRSFRSDRSGQVLVVTALLVALLLLSTAIYVIDVEKKIPKVSGESDGFTGYEQAVRSAMISALVNVTNGGDTTVLDADLSELETVILSQSYQAMLTMDYSLQNTAPYTDGFWISSETSGVGVSSAYVAFAFAASSPSSTSNLEYNVNVTSEVHLSGTYSLLTGNTKQVNLTVNVINEAKPALAQNFTTYFDFDGSLSTVDWVEVNSPSLTDFGNGTYTMSFLCDTQNRNDQMLVSMLCHDKRGVLVSVNAACTLI